eukprot:9002145-Ditylum_brightwellii.AAC.1
MFASPVSLLHSTPVPTLHSTSQSNNDFQSMGNNCGTHDFLQEYGIIDPESFVLQNGTQENSYVTLINAIHPERNRG